MEKTGISHQHVWEEAFTRTRDSLSELYDYVNGIRSGKIDPADPDLQWYKDFGLMSYRTAEVDDALDMAGMMLSKLECELEGATAQEARDEIITIMRENLNARLFEGESQASYQLCNDIIETLAMNYNEVCSARNVPAHAFLQQKIFIPAMQYAEVSRDTVEAMAGRVQKIMEAEGMQNDGIVTPFEFASQRVMQPKNRADNDDPPTFEQECEIQKTARDVMGCTVDGFHPVPFNKMCPEMVLMVEMFEAHRKEHYAPYCVPKSQQDIDAQVSRDFAKIYRACPEMAKDIGQLLQAVGRTQQLVGQAGQQLSLA